MLACALCAAGEPRPCSRHDAELAGAPATPRESATAGAGLCILHPRAGRVAAELHLLATSKLLIAEDLVELHPVAPEALPREVFDEAVGEAKQRE